MRYIKQIFIATRSCLAAGTGALALNGCGGQAALFQPSAQEKTSSHEAMSWIEEHLRQKPGERTEDRPAKEDQFRAAARVRWQKLAEALQADVAAASAGQSKAEFAQENENVLRVVNSSAGLELTLTADFENHTVRYDYAALNQQSAGVPEGGILSMRQTPDGGVEFYSADEQLTSQETCNVLLEPVQPPGRSCA